MSPQIFKSILLTFFFLVLIPGQAQLCEKVEHMNYGQKTSYGLRVCKVDWNKDGLVDFITGGYAGTKLQVHIQQTDGSYLSSSYASENIPSEHQSLAVGDFDKDGNPDLLVGGMPLTCLLGDGNNSHAVDYIVHPDYKTSLVVGDFDYDGNQDFIATGRTNLSLFWGDGAGYFTEQVIDTFANVYNYQAISANLQGKEATDIVVSVTFENKTGETYTYFNTGDRRFDKVLVNREASQNIFALHLHDDTKMDIVTISDRQIKIQTPQSGQEFTENNISLRNKHIRYAFALDLNQNHKNDIVLVDFSGGIYFLLHKGDGTFHNSPKLANIPSYPKDVEIFSFENNELKFLYNGNTQGIYTIYLPKMASWYPQYKSQPFSVITNSSARQNITSFLEKFFLLQDSHISLDVFSFQESAYCESFYGVFVEDTFYKFNANGKMIFSTNTLQEKQRYEPNFSTVFEPYNLNEMIAINSEKKKNGQGYNYTSFMIHEFFLQFYPDLDFEHFNGKVDGIHFEHKATRTNESNERQDVYLGFQAGEVTWTHWCYNILRAPKDNSFSIIKDENVAKKIQSFINMRYTKELCEGADIFFREYFSYYGDHFTEKNNLVLGYGVFIHGKLYLFDMQGYLMR